MHIQISKHIHLKPLLESDASVILNLVNKNRMLLSQFLYWVKDVECIHSARIYIKERIHSGLTGAHWFTVYVNGHASGVFAIKSICQQSLVAELGYWLCSSVHGHGIINQIINNFSKIMLNDNVNALEFRCLEQNKASINVALKAGAKLVDFIPEFMMANGVKQDLNIYRLFL